MGRRGRLPMPPHLRLLKGLPGGPGRLRPQVEATIPDEIPAPPTFLNGHGLAEWHRVTPELHRLGLLSVLDIVPLATYCATAGAWCDATEALTALPETERLVAGRKANPLIKIIRDAAKQAQALGAPFGLAGPNSRSRLVGVVRKEPGKFDGFIAGDDEPAA